MKTRMAPVNEEAGARELEDEMGSRGVELEHFWSRPRNVTQKFLRASDIFSSPVSHLKASFRSARSNTVSGAPSPSPLHRERSGRAGQSEK
jgi:hypothetical protein